jgi:hypothetical protein
MIWSIWISRNNFIFKIKCLQFGDARKFSEKRLLWLSRHRAKKKYSIRIEIFVAIDFFHNFDYSSYSKNYASIIYYAYYILYYCWYFKLDLSFYTFAIIF